MFKSRFLHFFSKFYGYFVSVGSNLQSLFLLWMRLTWGHQFFLVGLGKLATIDQVTTYFSSLGIPHSHFYACLVAFIEIIGGLLLIAGFASRIAGLVCAFTMITAIGTAHSSILSHFRFLFDPSAFVGEAPYPFLMTSLLIFIFGPGRISIDGWIKRWSERQPKY